MTDIKKQFEELLPWEQPEMLYDLLVLTYGKSTADYYVGLIYDAENPEDEGETIEDFICIHGERDILFQMPEESIVDYIVKNDLVENVMSAADTSTIVDYVKNTSEVMDELEDAFNPTLKDKERDDALYTEGFNKGWTVGYEAGKEDA